MNLIILDRDGVINRDSDNYIRSVEEFIPLPGSLEAMARLQRTGWRIAVATNQSGIARGYFNTATLDAIHQHLHQRLAELGGKIETIVFCPHGPDEGCNCRKPRPGLYLEIGERLNVSLENVPIVGDSLRDLQAAEEIGASPILVRTGKGERTLAKGEGLAGIPIYTDLAAVVTALLEDN